MKRTIDWPSKRIRGRWVFAIFVLCFTTAMGLAEQGQSWAASFASVSFDGTNGEIPYAGLIQAGNGNLYGTTTGGGANSGGVVFKFSPNGKLATVYSFCSQGGVFCTDGSQPATALVQGPGGFLYGTTPAGGANRDGTAFKLSANGTLTTLFSFGNGNGLAPNELILARDGNLYGTTFGGGSNGDGGIIEIVTATGTLKGLHSFDGTDGKNPDAGLVQANDGSFYGTTFTGGVNGGGTVFKITAAGTLTTLYNFCSQVSPQGFCLDGMSPQASLIQATDGNFYGTTFQGGPQDTGTVFKITAGGTLTTLYSFCAQSGCVDGAFPVASLIQAKNGNLYGTTFQGGLNDVAITGDGTVFKITTAGTLTTLYSFCSETDCADGKNPAAGLVQATNGSLYGTTSEGGANGDGAVFKIAP